MARGDLAGHQQGAETPQHTSRFVDESGFYPLPSVVRTDAPMGQTPIGREWWSRDHLSAIRAISPGGTLHFQSQDSALNAEEVIAVLAHLLREVPGRMGIIWDGSPSHRSQTAKEFLARGAAQPAALGAPASRCPGTAS